MSILVGVISACAGLLGVVVGAWINHRRSDRRWLRNKKLEGATEFITAAGQVYDQRRHPENPARQASGERDGDWVTRMRHGRSVIYLLCGQEATRSAEKLARMVWDDHLSDPEHRDRTVEALREFTFQMHTELTKTARKRSARGPAQQDLPGL